MTWEKLSYTKNEINSAGKILVKSILEEDATIDLTEAAKALKILDNWRAVHSYPMHVFQIRLKNKSQKIDKKAIISQRLKRVPSIIHKLQRGYHGHRPSMKLYQMQDISGCRAVLSNMAQIRELCEKYYLKGDLKHKRITFKDYVAKPKDDGYRSIHIVYEYKSTKGKHEYNGLRVEIQIRTKLQHLWATAIETVDFFTRQAIKSSEGHPDWAAFFKLVSSAFARIENCPGVLGTPEDEKELYSQIKKQAKELKVVEKMKGWKDAMQFFKQDIKSAGKTKAQFYLLELDILGEKLNIKPYKKEEEQKAINEYSALEKRHSGRRDYDVVLVGVDSANDLQKAYPNYFVDSTEFLVHLQKIIDKY